MGKSIEIPLGKRTKQYRFFEMLPGMISYTMLALLLVLSWLNATIAGIYLLVIILTMIVKAVGIAFHTMRGYNHLAAAQKIDWSQRLADLARPTEALSRWQKVEKSVFGRAAHMKHLAAIAAHPEQYPTPQQLRHIVIIAAYNESIDVIEPTIKSLLATTIPNEQLVIVFAYEERGGESIAATVKELAQRYGGKFGAFYPVMHPKDLPNEVVGKGGNITYAGQFIARKLQEEGEDFRNYIVTSLDCDNRPHPSYFDYVSYEYIVHKDRKKLSYQPIALFLNNIWDVPAPMRVIATGNSFWNIISSVRPDRLRNFASHSQPLDALAEMDFWSKRTIVEDGHQFWRSYFHFKGDYSVVPVYVPIYQDAVLSDTYAKTLVAQFKQLRRWAYGASDIPYVASHIFTKERSVPLGDALFKFYELLDGHVTLATIAILVTFGGWIPLLINPDSGRSISAHQLPLTVSILMQLAMVGLLITVLLSFKMLPPRPARYKRHRTVFMLLQWVLMPVTSVLYGALSALNAQTHLLFGRYLDKFDVTEKATVKDKLAKKQATAVKKIKKSTTTK
ncbi:MAG: glycosyltransferase family 2 protein [Candidatus Saccharibacteria bacterium]|nr:glycosyltransferase family 2 protein [Candidatus Saccharibacteria bacterium]